MDPPYSPHILALILPFSILGLLARLGLQALASYPGQSIFPLAYVQVVGCFIIGLAIPMKDYIVHK
jgi:fluoride ion exporter CrcB/FEX